jgi:uncharacterized membrane protein
VRRGSAALLGGITLLGALLRIWSPGRIGLWGDEVQFLNVSALPSYKAIVAFLYAHESHPPLFYFMAHAAGALTGNAEGVMASFTLTASIALIPAAWWLGSLSGRRGASGLAAALVALSVPLAALEVQVRPYALFSVLLVFSAGTLVRGSEAEGTRWRALWVVLMLTLLYLHHLAVFVLVAELMAIAWLAWRDGMLSAMARAWAPAVATVLLLAVPDLLMLNHQREVTGYLSGSSISALLPFRQLARLALTFPGELLVSILASIAAVVVVSRNRGTSDVRGGDLVLPVLSGLFLVLCLMLVVAGYRHAVLVEHLVLPFAPLGLAAAGIVIADRMGEGQRRAAFLWSQLSVACVLLSALFTVGWSKTDLDLVARYVDAEAAPGDLVIVIPGWLGAAFNRYSQGQYAQVDFPVAGAVSVYEFDHQVTRIRNAAALRLALDSIEAVSVSGRRVWLISPTKWIADSVASPPDPRSNEAGAFRERASILRGRLMLRLGAPSARMTVRRSSWSMEVLTLELFQSVRPHAQLRPSGTS